MSIKDDGVGVTNDRPLFFGIIVNSLDLEAWQYSCIRKMAEANDTRFTLAFIDNSPHKETPRRLSRFYDHSSSRMEQVNLQDKLSFKTYGICLNRCDDGLYHICDADVKGISSQHLDFIMNFTDKKLDEVSLDIAKYGVWMFQFYDVETQRYSPPGFWEILTNNKITCVVLERLTGNPDTVIILRKGYLKTIAYSCQKNIDNAQLFCASWPSSVCSDILSNNIEYISSYTKIGDVDVKDNPGGLDVLKYLIIAVKNRLMNVYKNLFRYEDWNIGIVNAPIYRFIEPGFEPIIHWYKKPKNDAFCADPFGVFLNGKHYVFFEHFDYRLLKGVISYAELTGDTIVSKPTEAIDSSIHLSYPYMFEYSGDIYCIPEESRSNEVCVYKPAAFPGRWEKVATIISDFDAADPTVIRHEGLYWLFCTSEKNGSSINLYIWYSTDLFGEWKPHPKNPVKTDIRSARPAGTPFVYNGQLYRPAQDSSGTYGGRITINKVTTLTPTDFKEEVVKTIDPYRHSPYPDGIHTISVMGDKTIIDSKRYVFIWYEMINGLLRYLRIM